jgi:hypothetical protein
MNKRELEKRIKVARDNVLRHIARSTDQDSKYSRGLAYEGYSGGYLAALDDVLQLCNGWPPDRNGWLNTAAVED